MPVSVTLPTIGDDGATYNNKIGGSLTALAAASDTNETNILTKVSKDTIVYNVKEHGVVGDGVTDDAPAINALITLIYNGASSINAEIYFPAGTYAIGAPIDLPFYSDKMRQISLYGMGRNATVLLAIGSTGSPFEAVIRHLQPRDSVTTIKSVSAGAAHLIHDLRIDAAHKAKFCIKVINGHAMNMYNLMVKHAAPQSAAGEPTAEIKITGLAPDYLSWEHHIGPNIRCEGGDIAGATASTYGLWINSSDNVIDDVVSIRHDTNANNGADFANNGGNNFWNNCHSFYSEVGYYSMGLDDGSKWIACEADNPLIKGFRIETSHTQLLGCNVFWAGTIPAGGSGFDIRWADNIGTVIVGCAVWDGNGAAFDTTKGLVNIDNLSTGHIVTANVGINYDTARRETAKTVSGTTYTLVAGDNLVVLECSNAAAVTLTVPTEATVYFMIGTKIDIVQVGTGQVTVVGAGGVTVNSNGAATTAAQWAQRRLRKRSANSWILT